METSKLIITRSDTDLEPVNKGELVLLLDQLKYFDKLNTVSISNDFLQELVKMSIDNLSETERNTRYGVCEATVTLDMDV